MSRFQRILHPTDFQEKSAEAFRVACELAHQNQAELVVLHVLPKGTVRSLDKISQFDAIHTHEKLWEALQQHHAEEEGLTVSHRLEEGDPAKVILQAARDTDADLLIIGPSSAPHGPLFWFKTTTLDELVHKAPCPVLVAQPKLKAEPIPPPKKQVTDEQVAEATLLSMETELGPKFLP